MRLSLVDNEQVLYTVKIRYASNKITELYDIESINEYDETIVFNKHDIELCADISIQIRKSDIDNIIITVS